MELRVNGTTLDCETIGEGPPCLVLHGGPGTDSSGLRVSLGGLAGRLGLRMVFYDHRGHGRSAWGPAEESTHDQLVADAEGVRTALGLGPVHVLGVSWGGFLALLYAARYPTSLRRLVVVGGAASHEFMPLAEANARRDATPAQWAAYRALWEAFGRLGEKCRQLLRVAVTHPQAYDEISEALGMPIGSIGPTRRRCLTQLRSLLEGTVVVEGDGQR